MLHKMPQLPQMQAWLLKQRVMALKRIPFGKIVRHDGREFGMHSGKQIFHLRGRSSKSDYFQLSNKNKATQKAS